MDLTEISVFIFDVDGVLTDGRVVCYESGEQVRTFLVKDGYAIEKALQLGFRVAIISGGAQEGVRKRLEFLGIKDVFLGVKNKVDVLNSYVKKHNLAFKNILYMGDDLPDFEVLTLCGVATCPADASEEIKHISNYISTKNGGNGAVREVIELVLKSQNKWSITNNRANG